jgi:hypothetical protein
MAIDKQKSEWRRPSAGPRAARPLGDVSIATGALVVTALIAMGCSAARSHDRTILGPLWTRECATSDGGALLRQSRQLGPVLEVGAQTTLGAGYLHRWALITLAPDGDSERDDVAGAQAHPSPRHEPDCRWHFGLFDRSTAEADDEVFVSRTEIGVFSGAGNELTGIRLGLDKTNTVRVPPDAWFELAIVDDDPSRSRLVVHRVGEQANERGE